jgi:hypothetical protein
MKLAGMLLLPAGWCIVISAVVLFPRPGARGLFVVAGLAIQAIGLILAFRGSGKLREEER